MNKILFPSVVAAALLAAGCTMAPKYARPAAPVAPDWPQGAAYVLGAAKAPQPAQLKWQEFFTDARLQQVIGLALTNNRDLRLATLNLERARAMYGIQRDALFPTIDATARESKARVPADLSSSGRRMTTERNDINLGVASWEIDFFGRIRSLKESALQDYLGTAQARRTAQILLVSSVANAYLGLAADSENLRLAETTLAAQKDTLELIRQRFQRGIAPELDLHRAQAQVDVARGDVARYTEFVAQDENALNLLVGSPVPKALLPADLGQVGLPREIRAGMPSEVLLRRPDVMQAENQLKAAHADLGAARAAFFPRISLTAAFGTASSDLSGLFKAGSGAWSYAPQIVMPVFDARTWSAHRAAKVQREMAVTQYERSIQGAFREVADALATSGTMGQRVEAQESLVHATSETHRLSKIRYDGGLDSYLSVLDAQRSLYASQQGLVALRYGKLANQVRLYAVLGGGL